MFSPKTYLLDWMTLYSNVAASSDNGFFPVTGFMSVASIIKGRARMEMRNRIGSIEVIGAVQFANNPADPDANPVLLGSTWLGANAIQYPAAYESLSGGDAKQFGRLGYVCRNTSGSGSGLSLALVCAYFDLV